MGLAGQLNQVISRSVWLDRLSISDSPKGLPGDDLPAYRDELINVRVENEDVPIWLQRIPRPDGVMSG